MVKHLLGYHVLILLILIFFSCSDLKDPENPGAPYPNLLPETTLANIPLENSQQNPYFYQQKFYWDGGDEDGYIVGYKYRVDDNEWVSTEESFATIDFASPDSINFHTFEVKAIDNDGGEDDTPAQRSICTRQTAFPETKLLSGPPQDKSVFILADTTEIWQGIEFVLSGEDSDGTVIAYEYAIDDSTTWIRTENSTIYIFGALTNGTHLFYARAIDNAAGIDPTPIRHNFIVIAATLEETILIIDESRDGTGSAASPNDQMIDDFYRNILSNFECEEYDLKAQGGLDAGTFAAFDLIVWHDDERSENLLKTYIEEVESYLQIGGKIFISGWRTMETADDIVSEDYIYSNTDFGYIYFQLESFKYTTEKEFCGARGENGYPDLTTDAGKMLSSYEGKLNYCGALIPFDMANQILTFDSFSDDPTLEGKPCAVKFFSDSYRAIALGFPLYVINELEAKSFMTKAINDLRQ